MDAQIKTFAIATGSYQIKMDDIFQGKLPSRLICAFVKGDEFSGSYQLNPYNFVHCNVDQFQVFSDHSQVPFNTIHTKFSSPPNYQEAYINLFTGTQLGLSDRGTDIQRKDFSNGYALFVFDLDSHSRTSNVYPALRFGNCSIEVALKTALTSTVTMICYGTFPAQIQIDKARAIIT